MNQNAKNQEIKLKFHATAEISEHVDLMKYEKFFSFQKNVSVDTIKYSFLWRVTYV